MIKIKETAKKVKEHCPEVLCVNGLYCFIGNVIEAFEDQNVMLNGHVCDEIIKKSIHKD